jgi:hypothetical protein
MTPQVFSSQRGGGESVGLHDLLSSRGITLQQALQAFQQDYAPVVKVVVRRRRPVADAPSSAFLKQR